MVSHTLHPDSHEHGLSDDCERCAQLARYPGESLDNENLTMLLLRVLEGRPARSGNERLAMDEVEHSIRLYRKLRQVMPSLEFEAIGG